MSRCVLVWLLLLALPVSFAEENFKPRAASLPAGAVQRLGSLQLWHAFQTFCVAFSPDGKSLVTGGDDGKLRWWDRATGAEVRSFDADRHSVGCVACSPDGKVVAFGRGSIRNCDIGLLDVARGKVGRIFTGKWPTHSLIFTPDGKSLIAADYEGVALFDPDTCGFRGRVEIAWPEKQARGIGGIALSPDGKTLAVAMGFGKVLVLWDLAAEKELRRWDADGGDRLAFSADGTSLVSARTRLYLWDVATGKETAQLEGHFDKVWHLAVSPTTKLLASASDDGTIRLWDLANKKQLHSFGEHHGRQRAVAFSPDGKTLASAGSKISLWDAATQKDQLPLPGHKDGVFALAVAPAGNLLASTGFDRTLRVWNLTTGVEQRQMNVPGWFSGRSAFSADGTTLAWCDAHGVYLADAATGQRGRQFATDSSWCVALSPDGKLLARGCSEHGIELRNLADGAVLSTLDTDRQTALDLTFSPDGSTLAAALSSGGAGCVVLWEIATRKERLRLTGHTKAIKCLTFAPNGRQVVTSSNDDTVRLWDVRTGKEVRRFQGVDSTIFSAAFSPDGNTVAGAAQDGTVRVWETATGKERCRFTGHHSWAMSVVFAPDGRRLISGGHDTTCLVWDLTGQGAKPPPAIELPAAAWDALWTTLAGHDAGKANLAIWQLAAAKQTASQFAERLPPVAPAEAARVAEWVRQLNSDDFEKREAAQRDLEKFVDTAEAELLRTLASKPAPETQRRIEDILERTRELSPERLRTLRALEVLEQVGSPEARALLERLAQGLPEARLTQTAKAALQRLQRRAGRP